jgi:hypothetical protein
MADLCNDYDSFPGITPDAYMDVDMDPVMSLDEATEGTDEDLGISATVGKEPMYVLGEASSTLGDVDDTMPPAE